jgi:hypothetical protein
MSSEAKRRGAPLELNRETVDAIASAVELGAFISAAVAAQGFSRRAYQRWDRIGKKAVKKPEEERNESESVYAYYFLSIQKAAGRLQCNAEHKLYEMAESDPEVMKYYLAKRFPEEWSDKAGDKPSLEDDGSIISLGPEVKHIAIG